VASGIFPLGRYAPESAKRLREAANLVEEVIKDLSADVFSGESGGMQFDNAASDGGSIARLRLAVELIEGEIA
jgi:hypothetical protein